MKKLRKYLKNSQWAGVLSLGLGTIIGQSINILVQPIITRLVSPNELGIYSFMISMANLIIPIASLKLYMLIVVKEEDAEADDITIVSLSTVFLVSLLYAIFISIMLLFQNNSFSDIGIVSFVIPIMVLTNGVRFVLISYNNRYKKYSVISKTEISREISKGLIQIFFGLLHFGAIGQAIGYAISPLISLKLLANNFKIKVEKFMFKKLLNSYKKNIRHIVYLVPAQFINSFSYTLITTSIISLFSTVEAGYYSISITVLGLPLVVISNNVSRIFLQRISEDFRCDNSVWKTYKTIITTLSIVSIMGFVFLAVVAPKASEMIFGDGYATAGKYISILSAMYGLRFVASSIVGGYVVFNRQKMDLIFQSVLVVLGVIIFFVTKTLNLNISQYLFLISIGYGANYFLVIIYMGYLCRSHSKKITSDECF